MLSPHFGVIMDTVRGAKVYPSSLLTIYIHVVSNNLWGGGSRQQFCVTIWARILLKGRTFRVYYSSHNEIFADVTEESLAELHFIEQQWQAIYHDGEHYSYQLFQFTRLLNALLGLAPAETLTGGKSLSPFFIKGNRLLMTHAYPPHDGTYIQHHSRRYSLVSVMNSVKWFSHLLIEASPNHLRLLLQTLKLVYLATSISMSRPTKSTLFAVKACEKYY